MEIEVQPEAREYGLGSIASCQQKEEADDR